MAIAIASHINEILKHNGGPVSYLGSAGHNILAVIWS